MKVEEITNGSLRIWLSEAEMQEWGLSPSGEEKQAAIRLVRRILRHVPRPAERLLAELIPVEGGSVLLVSAAQPPTAGTPAVYRLFGVDALLELVAQWRALPAAEMPACCLYEREGEYDLVVYPAQPLSRRQRWLLAEYGQPVGYGEGLAAYCAERGRLLAAGSMPGLPPLSETSASVT